MRINTEADVTINFGLDALIKNKIGLKKIPPPIPNIPDKKPINPHTGKEINKGIFL